MGRRGWAGRRERARQARALAPDARPDSGRPRVTPYQHHTLCRRLGTEIEAAYREGAPAPSLVVCPAVDARYRDDDVPRGAARRLLESAVDHATAVGARHRCPVLFTRAEPDGFTAPVVEATDRRIECEQTRFGPRVVAPDDATVGTHTYDLGDGGVQTTFAYWRAVLDRRHAAYDAGGADVAESVAQPREV